MLGIKAILLLVTLSSQETAAKNFVQQFYDWYVPKALAESKEPSETVALRERAADFDTTLAKALQQDLDAQAKANEIVGIDFDAFLSSQDPCERYSAGEVTKTGGTYRVKIYATCDGKKNNKPDVIAEVAQKNGRWQFVNFHYPEGGDLLSVLKQLRDSRTSKPASRPAKSHSR